jgi:hypothetical protein
VSTLQKSLFCILSKQIPQLFQLEKKTLPSRHLGAVRYEYELFLNL